jgi:WhiB family redox-sensing transcriptional regulator
VTGLHAVASNLRWTEGAEELGRWQEDAACRGEPTDSFFPDSPHSLPPEIRVLCSACAVREDCLDHALEHEPFGIWGGMSEAALARLRKIRRTRVDRPENLRGGGDLLGE